MISGECRVEGIPSPGSTPSSPSAERKLAIEGLRLQLDLRILPGTAGGDATAAAVWRIESENLVPWPLSGPAARRRAALATGVVVAALSSLAIGLWFANPSRRSPDGDASAVAPAPTVSRAAPPELARAPSAPAPALAPERADAAASAAASEDRRVAPRIAVVPAEAESAGTAAPPASTGAIAAPTPAARPSLTPASGANEAPPRASPPKVAGGARTAKEPSSRTRVSAAPPVEPTASSAAAPAGSPLPPASAESPRRLSAAPRTGNDLLDLFGDTK